MLLKFGRKVLNMFAASDKECLHPVSPADETDAVRGPKEPAPKPEQAQTTR